VNAIASGRALGDSPGLFAAIARVASAAMNRRSFVGLSVVLALACGGDGPPSQPWVPGAQGSSASADDEGDDDDGTTDAPDDDGHDDDGHDDGSASAPDDDGGSDGGSDVPELGSTLTVIATAADGLATPRDLQFAPDHPDQLWTFDTDIHGVVILFDPGTPEQRAETRIDTYAQHFMSHVSSAAFGADNQFSSCQESRNDWNGGPQPPDDFMGPTLWSADLDIFAAVNQDPSDPLEGSHLDMLHQSPLCMGIAHEADAIYWVFDGLSGDIVRYDFMTNHGPGGSDHSDGTIHRFLDADVTRVEGVPGHMVLDPASAILYVADTGAGRVMALDTQSGEVTGPLGGDWDGVHAYDGVEGATWEPVVTGLQRPSGLALADGRLFVGDHATGEIVAFDLDGTELGRMQTDAEGLMGLEIGPDGKLWLADGAGDRIVRVDP
jgi:sugar lactone lactonase YvrE